MPRKQNGWGNSKSLAFKGGGRVDKGKGVGAFGYYPSNRRYGSSVHRTIIEKYNLDSNWVKWRKGYEYYNQAAWYRLQDLDEFSGEYKDAEIKSVLYQGTPYEIDVTFDGYKFATKGADSNNHYVMKRTNNTKLDIGYITSVQNDEFQYPEQKKYGEIWCQGIGGTQARALLKMIGERITDGETEATLDFVLTSDGKPMLYIGKTGKDLTTVKLKIRKTELAGSDIQNYQDLVGKIAYIKDFFVEKPSSEVNDIELVDESYNSFIRVIDSGISSIDILNPENELLPTSLYDIKSLEKVLSADACSYELDGTYVFDKNLYQRFFGRQYFTAEMLVGQTDTVSYSVMPFAILGVTETETDILLISVPFQSEIRFTLPPVQAQAGAILVFSDKSFTKSSTEMINYTEWKTIDTDVNPWMDEVFTSGQPLQPATVYTCSCPNHSHSILRAPQATEDEGTRKVNRQRRYPLPTVLGQSTFQSLGKNSAAGLIESWESREHRMSFKMCKHSIAAMFIDKVKIKEPNSYPTYDARKDFEEKLVNEIAEVMDEFVASYKRGGITALEVVFALAQGLNLDDVETAYVMLNSTF